MGFFPSFFLHKRNELRYNLKIAIYSKNYTTIKSKKNMERNLREKKYGYK